MRLLLLLGLSLVILLMMVSLVGDGGLCREEGSLGSQVRVCRRDGSPAHGSGSGSGDVAVLFEPPDDAACEALSDVRRARDISLGHGLIAADEQVSHDP